MSNIHLLNLRGIIVLCACHKCGKTIQAFWNPLQCLNTSRIGWSRVRHINPLIDVNNCYKGWVTKTRGDGDVCFPYAISQKLASIREMQSRSCPKSHIMGLAWTVISSDFSVMFSFFHWIWYMRLWVLDFRIFPGLRKITERLNQCTVLQDIPLRKSRGKPVFRPVFTLVHLTVVEMFSLMWNAGSVKWDENMYPKFIPCESVSL